MKQPERKSCRLFAVAAKLLCVLVAMLCLAQPDSAAAASYHKLVSSYSWTYWNNAYPWGATHNGSAYMLSSQVTMGNTWMNLRAQTTSSYSGYRFKSGTVYAKQQVICNSKYYNWWLQGYFKAYTSSGSWPAFWLTGVNSWPPESDIMEFKGNTSCWQNTMTGSSWQNVTYYTKTTTVSNPYTTWHRYAISMSYKDATNVYIDYYIDGTWIKRDTGDFSGKPMYCIVDFQTDGSSGYATWTDSYLKAGAIEIGVTY